MSDGFELQSSRVQAELLLDLSSGRREQGERLARHEFRDLMGDLRSGRYLLETTGAAPAFNAGPWGVSAARRKAIWS